MTSTFKKPFHALLLGSLLATTVWGPVHAESLYSDLPDIGDSAGAVISPEQEKQLGGYMMRQLRQSEPASAMP